MIAFRGTNVMLAAALAGEIDYASFLPFFVGAAARGLPVKIVGSITKSSSYAMIGRSDVPSVAGLRGKRIGINSFGSSADFAAYAWTRAKTLRFSRSAAARRSAWPRWRAVPWTPPC